MDTILYPEKIFHGSPSDIEIVRNVERNRFKDAKDNLNNYLMMFPLEQLSPEFVDKLLVIIDESKSWIGNDFSPQFSKYLLSLIDEELNLISKIPRNF